MLTLTLYRQGQGPLTQSNEQSDNSPDDPPEVFFSAGDHVAERPETGVTDPGSEKDHTADTVCPLSESRAFCTARS